MGQAGVAVNVQDKIQAGKMQPWDVGDLPPAPIFSLRQLTALIGPGLLMVGANIGGGEWLFGPAVTAQYGATLMWLAALSIIFQVFYNLEVTRYTLYCGEPINCGWFRVGPGPLFWTIVYLILDFGAIWPYLAANAAVPLLAAFKGALPDRDDAMTLKWIGTAIFLGSFLPLIFGGKIYNALEKVMIFKLVLVLAFLTFVAVFICSATTAGEIFGGFFRVGTVPIRPQTVIVADRFSIQRVQEGETFTLRGVLQEGQPMHANLRKGTNSAAQTWALDKVPTEYSGLVESMLEEARRCAADKRFLLIRTDKNPGTELLVEGVVSGERDWKAERIVVSTSGQKMEYQRMEDVPAPFGSRVRSLLDNLGIETTNLVSYFSEHGKLPDLDWAVLAGFAAIAGAGGLTNAQLSNYARDKGWGMGDRVGAIPSAIGGKTVELSHVGCAFRLTPDNLRRWVDWRNHVRRDQLLLWVGGCFLGMALPSMMSLEFIRNAPVQDDAVAALTAQGITSRTGWQILWPMTLLCGFMVLAPAQISTADGILRRWTDVIWTGVSSLHHLDGNKVRYVYYSIMVVYAAWGIFALWFIPTPFLVAVFATIFMNISLGFSAFHTLWVNCTLLPKELRPNWFEKLGLIACGIFFVTVCAIAVNQQLPRIQQWLSS